MVNPPTGTVTFLFTDIEGSTRRWEAHPEQMGFALARHDAIMRQAIESNGGYVFKTIGDAFCAAFPTATQALDAALSAQRALHNEQWDAATGPVTVRIALHVGSAEERGGDYFGPPVNRVARLLSGGHGGQVLLSNPAYDLVRDSFPAGVSALDLGEHRLKDLFRPEHIFQLAASGLPAAFPALRTLDNRPTNLPMQPTPLIGREKEVAAVAKLLDREDVRLLTLTGPGGTGKTRLGLQAAAELLEQFRDGVFFANLAPITEPGLVVSTIAQVLGVKESGSQPLLDTLRNHLVDKQILLVLDNFEQVIKAAPSVGIGQDGLLSGCPQVKVLATSRVPLNVRGEHEYSVPPLGLPPVGVKGHGHTPIAAEHLTQYEAVRLFIERAQAVKSDFAVTNDNAPATAEICHRLDGLPLAIELAAARIRLLTPQAMLSRLQNRLKLLTGGAQDLPARQQTLRATIEWSYDLLSPKEQKLFRRLAVFVGGRTLDAVEATCDAEGDLEIDVLEGVVSLISKSLLRQEEGADGEPRFVMLETIHEYAREKLEESGEVEEMRRRHAHYFAGFVERAEPELRRPDQARWFATIEEEHDNIRAALQWAAQSADSGDIEIGLRTGGALHRFWQYRGYYSEGRDQLLSLLSIALLPHKVPRAKILHGLGRLTVRLGEYERGKAFYEQSIQEFRRLGEKLGLADALDGIANAVYVLGDIQGGRSFFEESLSIYRELGADARVAGALNNVAEMERFIGEYGAAKAHFIEAAEVQRKLNDRGSLAHTLGNLGNMLQDFGDPTAADVLRESLSAAIEVGATDSIPVCLLGLAWVAAARNQPEKGAVMLGAVDAWLELTGNILWPTDLVTYKGSSDAVRGMLNEQTWEQARSRGRAMSMEQVAEYALRDDPL